MIVKFDHIAFSCSRDELDVVLANFPAYQQVFHEKNLPNINEKQKLLRKDASNHDIVLLRCIRGGVPIEITAYDMVDGESKYVIQNETIFVNTSNISESSRFYTAIGFKSCGNEFFINTLMDVNPIKLQLKATTGKCSYFLDNRGYCCICLMTNNAIKEKKRLDINGIKTTKIDKLKVHGNILDIFFAYNNIGDTIEFICPYDKDFK